VFIRENLWLNVAALVRLALDLQSSLVKQTFLTHPYEDGYSIMISGHRLRILNTDSLPKQLILLLLASFVYATLLCPAASGQKNSIATPLKLGRVEFIGLRRLTQEQALAVSGLQAGDLFSEAAIEEAGKKLMDSGLFANLAYRVKSTGNVVTITFQVEEATRSLPIVFDNFVWFNDADLFSAIRRDVPFFIGNVPESGSVAETIAKALQRVLDEKKIPGHVEHMPEENLSHGLSYVFSVRGVDLPVCSLHFPGASGISEDELRKASKQLTERDYSKTSTAAFAAITLFPLYRHVGRLHAKFDEPSAVLETADSPSCKGGLSLTIPVDEGAVYTWEKAQWAGHQSVSTEELDAALGMKSGDVADGLKIDKGMQSAAKAFGHKGHVAARIKPSPDFDETNHRVTFKLNVDEGPEYHMGNLTILGLAEDDAARVKEDWILPPGAFYDAAYVEDFMKKGLLDVLRPLFAARGGVGWPPAKIGISEKPDRQKLTVDVTITIK
jgi:outer membrane protein insertion porin family